MQKAQEEQINDIRVVGGKKLKGTITTNGSKNASVGLLSAALLNRGTTTLHNLSLIEDVFRHIEIMEALGVKVEWTGKKSLKIQRPEKLAWENVGAELIARAGRSTLLFLPALIHNSDEFTWFHGGGCKMGERSINAHRHGLEQFGVSIKTKKEAYQVKNKKLTSADITLYEESDTATENLLMMASLVNGETTLRFASPNYQVQGVCFFLETCGVEIEGIGTSTLKVKSPAQINVDVEYTVSEDPIESMMFIAAGITTKSEISIKRCPIDFLRLEIVKLEAMGASFTISNIYKAKNERTDLVDITVHPSELRALPEKIHALPYPGINSDNLPFFVPICTQAKGQSMIHDWMWENRAIYYTELNRLGADIVLADPHRVFITGPTELRGGRIVCPPALRPSMIILVAMLASEGESILHSVHSINRGYENIFERLGELGADIKAVSE